MKHNRQGFTLIEFLISLSLGLYLVTFSTSLYLNLQKTIFFLQGISEIEANSCVALSALTRDIRMTGFIGAPHLLDVTVENQKDCTPTDSLLGWHRGYNSLAKSLPIHLSDLSSDVLLIQYAEPNGIPLLKAAGNVIQCNQKLHFHPATTLLIADCQHAEALQLSNVQLRHTYQKDAMLSELYRIIYYVAPTGRKNANQQPTYALYRRNLNAPSTNPIELVEGVEKLEICYGVLAPGARLIYLKADAIDNWLKVKTVQLTLYLSSLENSNLSLKKENTTLIAKNDKRLKRQWQQTVTVRSRSTWV